jgi:PAS domain S-box-containing protein
MPEPTGHPASWSPLFEALPQGVLLADREGRYLEANAAASRILGYDRATLLASRLPEARSQLLAADGSPMAPDDTPGAVALRTGKAVARQVLGMVRDDGDVLWLSLSAEPLPEGGVLVSFDDVTRQQLTETILASRTRIAEMASSATLEQILRATLDEAERLTGSCIGFFHFMEEDQQTLTLQAWSTRTESEFCHAEGHGMHYAVDKAGVWVDAVHARRPVIHNDYASLPHKKGMPAGHATVMRELVVPVLREERIVALLGVGNKPFPYGNRDLQTVQRLADLAWDIAERKRSEVALRQSEVDYRTLFESMAQGAFRQGPDGRLLDVNMAALELLGLDREEFLERTSMHPDWDVVDGAGRPIPGSEHPSMLALATGQRVTGRLLGVTHRRSGDRVWLEVNAVPEFRAGDPRPYRVMVTLHDLTERRKLEASLLESETRWHTVVEQAGDGFELLDEEGRFLQVNGATCRALGYSREELLQMSLTDIDPIVTPETYRRRFQSLMGKPPITVETIHRRKDGTEFPTEVTVSIIRLGGCWRALTQARDISDRKRSEAAVQAAKDLLDQVLDSLEAHVAVLDRQGNILAVNEPWRRFARANGIRETIGCVEQVNYLEVLDRSCQGSSRDTVDIRQGLADVLAGHRSSFQAEYPCDSPTEQRWFRMQALPLQSAKGGAVVTHENITEEKLARLAVEQANQQLAYAQRAAGAGMWEWDLMGERYIWSRELFELFGLDPDHDEATTETWRRILHPDDLPAIEEQTAKEIAEGKPFSSDYRIVTPDGQVRWIHAQGSFDLDALGRPIRMAGICMDHTSQKLATLALDASVAHAKVMLRTARDGVWLIDQQGRFKEVNEAACRMLGTSTDELLTMSVADVEVLERPEAVRQHIEQIAQRGWDVFESRLRRKDGAEFPVEVSVTHQPDLGQLVVFVRDITERKQSELALRQAEARLRSIFENSGDAIGVSLNGVHTTVNPAYCQMFGFDSADELIGQPILGLIAPECHELVLRYVKDRAEGRSTPSRYEITAMRKDGRRFDMSVNASSYELAGELFTLVILRDITARNQAAFAVMQSERQYRGLFDSMKEGFALHEIITDEGGHPVDYRYLDVNPAFVAMTGLPREQWLGRTVLEILPGTESRWIQQYGKVALTGQPITFEDESKDLGRWYRVNAYQPAPRQFAVLVTDITTQRCSDLERARLEQQIAKTQKMESLGSLAGGVAHDMNNVLGAIMGLASIHQEQEPVGSRLRRSMDTILKACTRGRTLVKGLLGFARQGLEEVRLLDLNDVVREDVALLERTIPASIQLKTELADGLRAIHGDPSSLSHVLMNLCVNAIDAMPGGGVLRIQTRNLEPDEVELEVSDTGCGMPPEVLEKALDPFFTTKGQGKGTGLGLAIVYGTVKAHHGRLGLDSKVGCGTRVQIQFPATLTEAVAELPGPQQPRGGPSLSLLVVDDDELIQESLSGLLHAMGHSAILAASGEEALQRLREGLQVHCVMLDLNMPGLGGSGTLPLLRAAYPDLPVLLATGRADQTAMDLVARHARTLLLPKPFTTEEIAGHLRQLGLG